MDYRSAGPSSSSSSSRNGNGNGNGNGFRYFDTYGSTTGARGNDRPGIVRPSFASSSSSRLPASLGLRPSSPFFSSTGVGTTRNDLRGLSGPLQTERRIHSDGRLAGAGVNQAHSAMRFGSGSFAATQNGSATALGAADRHDSSTVVRRAPIPGLPPNAQLMASIAPQSSAKNFLVPIGSTGARQKLSIANASQRRKLTTSDEVRWPSELPRHAPMGGTAGGQTGKEAGGGLAPGPPQFATLPRSRSEGLIKTWGSAADDLVAPSGGAHPTSSTSNGRGGHFGESMHRRLASSQSSSSLSSISNGLSNGTAVRANGRLPYPYRPGSAASSGTFGTTNGLAAAASVIPTQQSLLERPSLQARSNSLSAEKFGRSAAPPPMERALTSTEVVQAAKARALGLPTESAEGLPLERRASDGAFTPNVTAAGTVASKPHLPLPGGMDPRSAGSPAATKTLGGPAPGSHVSQQNSGIGAPSLSSPRAAISGGGSGSGIGGARSGLKGIFMKRETPTEDAAGSKLVPAEVKVLSSAEQYKQSMLERDLRRSAAEEIEVAVSEDTPLKRADRWGDEKQDFDEMTTTSSRSQRSVSQKSVSLRAPTIDFELPESSFFNLTGEEASDGSGAASSRDGRLSSPLADGESPKDANAEDSDRSTGSFEGAYVHPALGSTDSPHVRPTTVSNPNIGGSLLLRKEAEDPMSYDKLSSAVPSASLSNERISDLTRPATTAAVDAASKDETPSASSTASASASAENTPRLAASGSFGPAATPSPHSTVSDLTLGQTRASSSNVAVATVSGLDDPLATPKRSRSAGLAAAGSPAPAIPARSKHRAGSSTASPATQPTPPPREADAPATATVGPSPSAVQSRAFHASVYDSADVESAVRPAVPGPGGLAMRDLTKRSLDEEGAESSMLASAANVGQWQRSADPPDALSPDIRQSRFSEASTDVSDSRTPTRNEHRLSALDSSDVADEGEDPEEDESSIDDQMLPTSAWAEVENALRKFRDRNPAASADRGNLLRTVLLPFLALEAETASVDVVGSGLYVQGKARRALFFEWIRFLLLELQHVQTSADRGAILESIACVIESRNFSMGVLSQDSEDEARFSSVFGHILSYAIGELNKKGVYQNTLIFSGRLLAVAFFRVDGVATKLLRALPVNRFALERVAKEAGWQQSQPADPEKFRAKFPVSLRQLCFKDARSYLKMLDNESVSAGTEVNAEDDRFLVRQPEVEVEMTGNWLRRWQSDDSELFFSFCRSYHRQLAGLFASSKQLESVTQHFFGGPGYAHLATCVHQKCLALVHRVILSVTTLSSQKNFNPAGETANVLLGSTAGKPRVLEAANRRCTAIVVDIVRAPSGGNMVFAPMLCLHIKCLVKRTSLYDVQGVFCLLDWLDGVLGHIDQAELIGESLVDVSFIITTIGMLLEDADHALALMRTIAFCYANFGVLTATKENRTRFCEEILLKPKVFNKLFLSWSFTIRAYFLHLLVFRLARINDFLHPPDDPHGRTAVSIARLFNQRLEAIRKRHDQLSPLTDSGSEGDKSEADDKLKRRTASSFVSTIKKTPSITGVETSAAAKTKAERLLGMGGSETGRKSEEKPQSKAKNWLRALRGSKSGSKGAPSANGAESAAGSGQNRNKMKPVDEAGDADDDAAASLSPVSLPSSPQFRDSDSFSDASTLDGSLGLFGLGQAKLAPFEFEILGKDDKDINGLANHIASMPVGHDAGIASDATFDLQSSTPQPPAPGARSSMHSPRVSKAFSRRSSMLPGPASELVGLNELEMPPLPEIPQHLSQAYDETLHIYAVQSLREYEQTVLEHDEFFASLPKDQGVQVPRLPVNWPAMWSSTGE